MRGERDYPCIKRVTVRGGVASGGSKIDTLNCGVRWRGAVIPQFKKNLEYNNITKTTSQMKMLIYNCNFKIHI